MNQLSLEFDKVFDLQTSESLTSDNPVVGGFCVGQKESDFRSTAPKRILHSYPSLKLKYRGIFRKLLTDLRET